MRYLHYLTSFALLFICSVGSARQSNKKQELNITEAKTNNGDSPIFMYVEQMPDFRGDLTKYIDTSLRYPEQALKDGVEGRVIIKFVVNEDGSISDISIVRGISKECDAEAARVIKSMPHWKPGMQNGKAVRVFFTIPIIFRLSK